MLGEERRKRTEAAGREYQTLFFVTPRNAAACDTLEEKAQTRTAVKQQGCANCETSPIHHNGARASHTNLDMRAKREVLPVFFDMLA